MITMRKIRGYETDIIEDVVRIHISAFEGFFLSTMEKGFLRALYKSFCEHSTSDLMVAFDDNKSVGFIAYSRDTSAVYSYMLRKHFFSFVWYSFLAFLHRPSIIKKLISALHMPTNTKRQTHYVKIFSIGILPDCHGMGIGTYMLDYLKECLDFSIYEYITLETDAENNEAANAFYQKNGFRISDTYTTFEGRKMNKYHYRVR